MASLPPFPATSGTDQHLTELGREAAQLPGPKLWYPAVATWTWLGERLGLLEVGCVLDDAERQHFLEGYRGELRAPVACDECGGALAHVAAPGLTALLCLECNRDSSALDDSGEDAELWSLLARDKQLRELGYRAAADTWGEYTGGRRDSLPSWPLASRWVRVGHSLGIIDSARPLTPDERETFRCAYRAALNARW